MTPKFDTENEPGKYHFGCHFDSPGGRREVRRASLRRRRLRHAGVFSLKRLTPAGVGGFRAHFWRPFGTLWGHFGVLLGQIGSLLVPCRARFGLFCTLGVSFWFVVGEINLLRQYFAKKYTCIDLASNFLQIFRMQIIFPRPGGGTIAAGNRDRCPKKGRL